jgi:hypothetical protein
LRSTARKLISLSRFDSPCVQVTGERMPERSREVNERRWLLSTMTREPFQPVRLSYAIPDRAFVTARLRGLKCMVEAPAERCWQWLYHAEAAALQIGAGYDAVPVEGRPIVLGRIRFPKKGGMTLQTNSIDRASAAAQFFAPYLGTDVVAIRCRVVNRCFAADEGEPEELMKTLDQGVTVIDPREAELALARSLKGVRTMEDAERAAGARLQRRLASKEDVPMVEDFPLAPEEETPDFRHLATALGFRFARAVEHWRGNTDLTLIALIVRAVEGLGTWPPGSTVDDVAVPRTDPRADR